MSITLFRAAPAAVAVALCGAAAFGQYFNGFESNVVDWSGGAITRVASGTGGVTSAAGSWHATTTESGAFTRWGGYNYGAGNNVATAFQEYSTSLDIYLDIGGGWSNNTRFDWDSAISNSAGGFRRDFIFNAGFYNVTDATGSTPRFVVSASNNSQPGSAFPQNPGRGPIAITTTGWYTFTHHFYDNGGVLAVGMSITDSSNNVVGTWTLSDASDVMSVIGGNRYGWLDFQQFATGNGLPIDNARMSLVPTPGAAALGLVGAAAMRRRRR